jgi:hypothetical protein
MQIPPGSGRTDAGGVEGRRVGRPQPAAALENGPACTPLLGDSFAIRLTATTANGGPKLDKVIVDGRSPRDVAGGQCPQQHPRSVHGCEVSA